MIHKKKTKMLTVVIEERTKRVITRHLDASPIPSLEPKKIVCEPINHEVCQPISSLEAVLQWKAPPCHLSWSSKVVARSEKSSSCFKWSPNCDLYGDESPLVESRESMPKTLYCHDMKGGYLEDKFVKGCECEDPFTFFRWSGIDIFVYFSHELITIPPLGWINAAHVNGVTVLGTIITEGKKGKELFKKLLKDEKLTNTFCLKVGQMAQHYKFSGFLLNVENKIAPSSLPNFISFVTQLRQELKKVDPNNILIWYDSVTTPKGKVRYQNELNNRNCIFFDITDGIFLNYNWTDKNLVFSKRFAEKRALDVFVGVDVFGRGCFGGGGFNSHLAMKEIRKYNLSAAIFAPGWVFECQSPEEPFPLRDYLFWKSLYPYLHLSGPTQFPFKTSFSIGRGKIDHHKGQVVKEGPWYNLCRQEYQLSDVVAWDGSGYDKCISYYDLDSYNGGNCVILKSQHFERLFCCAFKLKSLDKLEITLAIKSFEECNGEVELLVKYIDNDLANKKIVLQNSGGVDGANKWRKRKFLFGQIEGTLVEIGCRLVTSVHVLIGEISMQKIKDEKKSGSRIIEKKSSRKSSKIQNYL